MSFMHCTFTADLQAAEEEEQRRMAEEREIRELREQEERGDDLWRGGEYYERGGRLPQRGAEEHGRGSAAHLRRGRRASGGTSAGGARRYPGGGENLPDAG